MQIIDNINTLWGDDLKQTLATPGARLKIAASCFSIYAYEALKKELQKIEALEFIFTSPVFVHEEVTDRIKKQRREFHIPKLAREKSIYGSEFEIKLKNRLTQKAIARECADWIRKKAAFRSNATDAPMQQLACVTTQNQDIVYTPLTLPITTEIIQGKEVFFVDEDALVACFDKKGGITEEFVKELAKYEPLRVVFRDKGFKDDSAKINIEQIFKALSLHTEVRTI